MPLSALAAAGALLAIPFLYMISLAVRTVVLERPVTPFGITQGSLAVLLGFGGAWRVLGAHGHPTPMLGVLAIAVCRLTGVPAIASDIDADAVKVTRDNARINGTAHLMRCVTAAGLDHPSISAHAPYDLIVANILARPLMSLAPAIARALSTRGRLILSGLTSDQVRMVRASYLAQGLCIVDTLIDANWATLTLARKQRGMA